MEGFFGTGLAAGGVAFAAGALAVAISAAVTGLRPGAGSRTRRVAVPVAGVAIVVASAVALDRAGPRTLLSDRLIAGVGLLTLGPAVVWALTRARRSWAATVITALAAIPGAAVVAWATSLENDRDWVLLLVAAMVVVGGALVADTDAVHRRAGLGPTLFAVAVVGMYATLPDTEQIAVVAGATLPIALLGWPLGMATLGPGAYGAVGLVGWVAAVGGRGRPGAVIGALACLGVMVIEPVVRFLARVIGRVPGPAARHRTGWLVPIQIGVVAATSRVAGLETAAGDAALISLLAASVAAVAIAVLLRPWQRVTPAGARGQPARNMSGA